MNEAGVVAFRAMRSDGRTGVYTWNGGAVSVIAESGGGAGFTGFEGLPLVDDEGRVVFRGDLADGRQGIFLAESGSIEALVLTGGRFAALARFPDSDGAGTVCFVATLPAGVAGVFLVREGRLKLVIDSTGGFETFRGALVDAVGNVVFYGTPRGGHWAYTSAAGVRSACLG